MVTSREYIKKNHVTFEVLRKKFIRLYFYPGATLCMFGGASMPFLYESPLRWLPFALLFGGGLWMSIGHLQYRCPFCKKTPPNEKEGFDYDPSICLNCGARLK